MPPKVAVNYQAGSDYHQKRKHRQTHAIRCLELAIDIFGAPKSLIDIGCGEGALVQWCVLNGIPAAGVDLAVPESASLGLVHHDLRQPLDLGIAFQWVLCWEVAEHLDPEAAETLCDTLTKHIERPAGRLLFTAATPGQRGPGHINNQFWTFWKMLLEERGLTWQAKESLVLADLWSTEVTRAPWYGKNIQVYAPA